MEGRGLGYQAELASINGSGRIAGGNLTAAVDVYLVGIDIYHIYHKGG